MRGIILAGGLGTRLRPLTRITNKSLVAVHKKPMIEYPLDTLRMSGISEIMVITGREHAGQIFEYLGSGHRFGVNFTYRVQDEAGGIAQALGLAEEFIGGGLATVILGDNIFEDAFPKQVKSFRGGARIFLKDVPDPERFGVAVLKDKLVTRIIEKPKRPSTSYAVTGLYQYDANAFKIIKRLKPSGRGELEITDVNNAYVRKKQLRAEFVKGFWSDAGTFDSLSRTIEWVQKKY